MFEGQDEFVARVGIQYPVPSVAKYVTRFTEGARRGVGAWSFTGKRFAVPLWRSRRRPGA